MKALVYQAFQPTEMVALFPPTCTSCLRGLILDNIEVSTLADLPAKYRRRYSLILRWLSKSARKNQTM